MISPFPPHQRLFNVLEQIIDPRIGIIREITEARREAGAPDLFSFTAQACNTSCLGGQPNFGEGGGSSLDRRAAMAKAIGEAIERYCCALYDPGEFPYCNFVSAPFLCTPPDSYAIFSQTQLSQKKFPFLPFTKETKVRWTPAIDLHNQETWYVPAAMVYLPYLYKDGESPITPTISTGLACHCSQEEAAVSAICEVIERDAFSITWQATISPPQLLLESLPSSNRDLINRFQRSGASVSLFNITLDHGIPTILGVLKYPDPKAPALLLSAASHLSPEIAICKTLEELGLSRRLGQLLKDQVPSILPSFNFENIDTQLSHVRLFCDHEYAHLADFLYRNQLQIDFSEVPNLTQSSPKDELRILVARLGDIGHQVLLADVTTPEIKELGLWVVRAVIPGFHPLFFGHRYRALGGNRLWTIPQKLGYEGISPETGDNPVPHPYP